MLRVPLFYFILLRKDLIMDNEKIRDEPQSQEQNNKKKNKIIVVVIVFLLLLSLLVYYFFLIDQMFCKVK